MVHSVSKTRSSRALIWDWIDLGWLSPVGAMSQHPLFDITPEHILALDDEGLRILIARLCKADLRRRGLPVSGVLYGGNQIAADGGIDVRVEVPADTEISGFIPRRATGFQAKADDMPASEIAKEMRPQRARRSRAPTHLFAGAFARWPRRVGPM